MLVSSSFASSIDSVMSHETMSLRRNPPFIDTPEKMPNPTASPNGTIHHLIDPSLPLLSSTTSSSRSTLSSTLNSPPPPPLTTSYSSYNSSACQSITSSPTDNTALAHNSKCYFPHSLSPTPLSSNSSSHVILPPISSFTNLITVAEREFNGSSNSLHANFTSPVPRTVLDHHRHELTFCNPNNTTGFKTITLSPPTQHQSILPTAVDNVPRSKSVSSLLVSGFPPSIVKQQQQQQLNSSSSASALPSIHSPLTNEHTSRYSSSLKDSAKITKQRKKKECPICHNFYANLSTHKSTHLTPEDRPHKCPICQRGFARNNDLIRHKKRHWKDEFMQIYARESDNNSGADDQDDTARTSANNDSDDSNDKLAASSSSEETKLLKKNQLKSLYKIKGAFKCPYNSTLINLDMEVYPHKSRSLYFEPINCHQTGVFSRCDTFKNHLKALHFEYPPKTKKEDRGVVPGKCKHCGLQFPNVDVWLNKHVGKGCGYSYH
ncbi:CLN_G0008410.mRNA.1.CDS.1 [Saccharomyces cerevisiae]|nr:CLN_G0008410.mRNA.1.CDS.1 [Saccharomyces cerevisiae]CAI7190148.1 CLN_G0008410.mRNA.1.CDS.1 [Saccharomyces cerevisiae]